MDSRRAVHTDSICTLLLLLLVLRLVSSTSAKRLQLCLQSADGLFGIRQLVLEGLDCFVSRPHQVSSSSASAVDSSNSLVLSASSPASSWFCCRFLRDSPSRSCFFVAYRRVAVALCWRRSERTVMTALLM